MNTNKIYIVLSFSGSFFSTLIRIVTRKKYSHASISLDQTLEEMYSFGRLKPYNPFRGGFVQEGKSIGTFKRFKRTKAIVLELPVSETSYNTIKSELVRFKSGKFGYNYLGVVYYLFNKNTKSKTKYYCSEFVKYMLDTAEIKNDLPPLVNPYDFLKIQDYSVVYEGVLRKYEYYSTTASPLTLSSK